MPQALFDSRELNGQTLYACLLAVGTYTIKIAGHPEISATVNVVAARIPQPPPTAVILTSDEAGQFVFSSETPPPFNVEEGAYLMFNYFAESDDPVSFSIQIVQGAVEIDSRALSTTQAFSAPFLEPGMFAYQAFMMTPGGDENAPPEFVLKFEGDIRVQDDVIIEDPVVVALDPATVETLPILVPTGSPVTWEVKDGSWYVVGKTLPFALHPRSKR